MKIENHDSTSIIQMRFPALSPIATENRIARNECSVRYVYSRICCLFQKRPSSGISSYIRKVLSF